MCVFLTLSSRQCMNACGLRSICSGCCSMQLSAANIRLDVAYEAHKYPFLAMHQFHKRQKKMDKWANARECVSVCIVNDSFQYMIAYAMNTRSR